MITDIRTRLLCAGGGLLALMFLSSPRTTASTLDLGAEQVVQAGGSNLTVPGHSVPAFVD